MRFHLQLGSHDEKTIVVAVACEVAERGTTVRTYDEAMASAQAHHDALTNLADRIETDNPQFNAWLRCSAADLGMMLTPTEHGLYPYAGVPWFDTTFGRDGIITALELLWLWPDVSRGVLKFLAGTQADETRPHAMRNPARSSTKRARAKWLRSARSHSEATTAASTRPRYSSCSPAPTSAGRATSGSSSRSGAIFKPHSSGSIATATWTRTDSSNTRAVRSPD